MNLPVLFILTSHVFYKAVIFIFTYIYSFSNSFSICVITEYWVEFPMLYRRSFLVMYSIFLIFNLFLILKFIVIEG